MRNAVIRSQIAGQAFILCPRSMDALLEFANQDTPRAESVSQIANNSVTYEKQGSVAIISVDGGMYKKDIGGMCSSVASYDQMVQAIDKAEGDSEVRTILFRVDTPGGSVAGADEVGDKIFNSKKKTVCLYENVGASGGIWVFSAADELYATETTILGSIGVIVSYLEPTGDLGYKRVSIVSKNASNKDCSLNGDCRTKTQGMLDAYEAMFYSRVERNTGFDAERIKTVFNEGDVIFASDAKDAGFIKDIVTFDSLLSSLKLGASPIAVTSVKSTTTIQQGDNMDDETFVAKLKSMFGAGEGGQNVNPAVAALQATLDETKLNLESKSVEVSDLAAKLAEAEKFKAEAIVRLQEAAQSGVSAEVALAMVNAESAESASALVIEANASTGGTNQFDATGKKGTGLLAYAEKIKGSVK